MGKSCVVDDFKDVYGMWRKSRYVEGVQCRTRSGTTWERMQSRCKVGGLHQLHHPTYIGCSVSDNFNDFQFFADWYTSQVGYGISGYNLDKDVLYIGNKVYSENNCILVPSSLNMFFVANSAKRGLYKQGVCLAKGKYFKASLKIGGKSRNLGYFKTEDEAYAAYKAAKEAEAYRWYERLSAGEFIVDPRVIERMRDWRLEE